MKKVFLLLAAALISVGALAQNKADEGSSSKSINFMSKDGVLLQKEFYDFPKIKGISFQVLIITDIIQNSKVGCLRIETKYYSNYTSDTYIGTLDADELGAAIKSLEYIKTNVITSTPGTYTEMTYQTRDKAEIGAFYNNKGNWVIYVKPKSYQNRSLETINESELESVIQTLKKAQTLISEKIQ